MKNLKLENILYDIKKNFWKLLALLLVLLCIFELSAFYEHRKYTQGGGQVNAEEQEYAEKLAEYNRRLESYDAQIRERAKSLEIQGERVAAQERYAGTAKLMKLDPAAVAAEAITITVTAEDGSVPQDYLQNLKSWFSNGKAQETLQTCGETGDLSELFTVQQTDTGFGLTLYYNDAERAGVLMNEIRTAFLQYAEEQKPESCNYAVLPGEVTVTVGEVSDITNRQNSVVNELNSVREGYASQEEALKNLEEEKNQYAEEGKPEEASKFNFKKTILYRGISAVLLAVLLFLLAEILKYICNDYIYISEDLKELGIVPLCEETGAQFTPELSRAMMDVKLELGEGGILGVCSLNPEGDEKLQMLCKTVKTAGIESILLDPDSMEFASKLMQCGGILLVAGKRKTSVAKVKELQALCCRYGKTILGGVLLE